MTQVLLLLPSSTYRASDFIDAASALDVDIVVASNARQAMADAMGARFLTVDFSDPRRAAEDIVAHAQRTPVDAIVPVDDPGVLAGALAAERLGLPHNPWPAVAATRDKARLRAALDAAGIPQPRFAVVDAGDDVTTAAREVGLPCVVKPVSLSASRGVIRADDPEAASAAAKHVRDIVACSDEDPDGPLLVEQFVAGDEVAVEGLLRGGDLEILAVFDKPDPLDGPYFEETIYVTPSRKPRAVLADVEATTRRAAAALGLSEGPIHAELRVGESGVTMLEIAARSIGGLCARSLRFGLGVQLEELILRHALGLPLSTLRREPAASGVMMLPIPHAGTLRGVEGRDAARSVPGVVGLEITVPAGRQVEPLPEGDRYLGFLFARGETPDDVEASLRQAHAELDIDIDATPA